MYQVEIHRDRDRHAIPANVRDAWPVLIEHRLFAIDPGVPGTTPLLDTNSVPVSLMRFRVLLAGK